MASGYWDAIVEDGGRSYRVPFEVKTGRVMCVALRPKGPTGRERFLDLDGPRAKQLIALGRELLAKRKETTDER